MQTIPANDMGCALVSCTAAFSFPALGHAHSPVKASCERWDERPQNFSGRNAAVLDKTQFMCWTGPEQASDVTLGHSGEAV